MARKLAEKKKPAAKAKPQAGKKITKPSAPAASHAAKSGAKTGSKSGGRNAAKAAKEKEPKEPPYKWLARKLQDTDPYFALDHSVSFLTDLFNHLISKNFTTTQKVESFIADTNHSVTLEQIFQTFPCTA